MGNDSPGGTTGQLELISTAIMDGWMAGLGSAQSPQTDALGQLLFEYSRRVYTSQLQHLKVYFILNLSRMIILNGYYLMFLITGKKPCSTCDCSREVALLLVK